VSARTEEIALRDMSQAVTAISPELLQKVRSFERAAIRVDQVPVATEHVLHAGMYARTVRLKPGTAITGALIKRATLLVVNGLALMLVNDGFAHLDGYNVIPASAGRKQVFVARGDVAITMIFPTSARTVEEAEAEFTDETDLLLSRRDSNGTCSVLVTREHA
jgi:hypothetical protein